ncbi:MAG: hypothetical protein JNM66_27605 [Bryobacterales bacterium]|nr:hypothetical protein [Bryobacterales bacterium]
MLAGAAGAQAPDSRELAALVIANEVRQGEDLGEYTFAFEKIHRYFNKAGQLDREINERGETYMSHRRNIDIALEWNGKPLKSKDLDKVRKAAARKLESDFRERQAANYVDRPIANRRGAGFTRNGIHMSVIDVLRYCRLEAVRDDNGRQAIPYSDCKSPWPEEGHYTHLKGTVWIHRATKLLDSWEARTPVGKLFFQQTTQPVAGGARIPHTWLLDLLSANGFFSDERLQLHYRWTNPQRFTVDVNQTIAEPIVK